MELLTTIIDPFRLLDSVAFAEGCLLLSTQTILSTTSSAGTLEEYWRLARTLPNTSRMAM
jgi:hypothetical protein